MHHELPDVISKLSGKFKDLEVVQSIKSGKEADVYLVGAGGKFYALKIYRPNLLLATQQEFNMLEKFHAQGAKVPKVFEFTDEAILMEYLGTPKKPAPRLIDVELTSAQGKRAYQMIIESITIFLAHGVVHGDLSAYNVLWWENQPYIIDFRQAVDIKRNPDWQEKLERDVRNISDYFEIDEKQGWSELSEYAPSVISGN